MRKTIILQTIILLAFMQMLCFSQTDHSNKEHLRDANSGILVSIPEPKFPGGADSLMAFVNRNLKYPSADCSRGIVYVQFTVDTLGALYDPQVINGICDPYDNEAIRVVSLMPKWIPAIEFDGKEKRPIKIQWVLPVKFNVK